MATAIFTFAHLGPAFEDDDNAVCLLSYSQSGNHFTRFVIEYLTKRPTHGCASAHEDIPIYLNEFPGKNPLSDVNPHARPAAYKFHYSMVSEFACSLTDLDGGRHCKKLILLIRDFAECIPRYFEGSGSPLHLPSLYLQVILPMLNNTKKH